MLFYKRGCYSFATADIKYLGVIRGRNIYGFMWGVNHLMSMEHEIIR